MKNNKFDFVFPPDFDKAQKHRLANRIFKAASDQESSQQCECCGKRVGAEKVETSCNIEPTQLSFLGPGVPLFFHFLKSVIILLLLLLVIFSGFSMYSNVVSSSCETNTQCITDAFNPLSIVNKQGNTIYLSVQSYLAVAYVVVVVLFFHYFRRKARQLKQECDEIVNSPSDYAIILRRLPANVTEQDVLAFVEQRRTGLTEEQLKKTENLKVAKVVLSYSLREYVRVREENKAEFAKCIKEGRVGEFAAKELPKPTETSQIAIVVFQNQQSKDFFILTPSICQRILQFFCTACTPLSQMTVKGQPIAIGRAPEPDEIYWQNSGITMKGALCRKLAYGFISLLILCAGGGAQYSLALLQSKTNSATLKLIFQYLSPLIVFIFNAIIELTLVIMTQKQRNQTVTQFQSVLVVKSTIFQFFNAGVFVILSKIAATYETFDIGNGIISQICIIMIIDAVVPNIKVFFLTYLEIQAKLKLCLVNRGLWNVTQMELNQMCVGPQITLPEKYAYVLKTLLLTALYAPMIPGVAFIALIGMILNYFIEKVLFAHTYSVQHTISAMTFDSSIELLEYFLLTFASGQLVVYAYFYNYQIADMPLDWTATLFATLVLAVLNAALPMEAINERLFSLQDLSRSNLTYSQAQQQFDVTYEMLNPAYQSSKRPRRSNKDCVGIGKRGEGKRDMEDMMLSATVENQLQLNKEPLLGELVAGVLGFNTVPKDRHQEIEMSDLQKTGVFRGEKDSAFIQKKPGEAKPKKQSSRFRIINVKEAKYVDKCSYRALVSRLMGSDENEPKVEPPKQEPLVQSVLAGIQKAQINTQQRQQHSKMVEEVYRENFGRASTTSKASMIHEERNGLANTKSSRQIAFQDPRKQQRAAYDPIRVGSSYKKFFAQPSSMLEKQGGYVNKDLVMNYLGTPFTNLLKTLKSKKQESQVENPVVSKQEGDSKITITISRT